MVYLENSTTVGTEHKSTVVVVLLTVNGTTMSYTADDFGVNFLAELFHILFRS